MTPFSGSATPFLDANGNNIPIISNTYKNGKGIIKLQKECYRFGSYVFSGCTSLTSIAIPDSVTSIGAENAFSRCTSLTSITVPKTITYIGNQAFWGCRSLTGITIPDSVTTIYFRGFCYCSKLSIITIPDSVTTIDYSAFSNCSKLSSITVLPETPPTLGSDAFDSIASNAVIYVPSASLDAYKSADGWSAYVSKIQAIP